MTRTPAVEIVSLHSGLIESLAELFAEIQERRENVFFHPHPFTRAQAEYLCGYKGKDQYYVLLRERRVLGYSMLRGWDEGFTIPSLGIFIRAEARGLGLGRLMVLHLHAAAQLRGATKIRLKVYRSNQVAKRMYEKLGYVFEEGSEGEELIGFCSLNGAFHLQ